jgi:hypothetical protein
MFLIWSLEHDAWLRPGEMGYTKALCEAGRYGYVRATQIVLRANLVHCHECMIPVEAVGLGAHPDPAPPRSDQLGDLLQWLAGSDPTYLRELEAAVRAHLDIMLRR